MKNLSPQCRLILSELEAGHALTPAVALDRLHIYALSQRIGDLKRAGYPIKRELVSMPSGARVARYTLEQTKSDDHIKLIKSPLQSAFPRFLGGQGS